MRLKGHEDGGLVISRVSISYKVVTQKVLKWTSKGR